MTMSPQYERDKTKALLLGASVHPNEDKSQILTEGEGYDVPQWQVLFTYYLCSCPRLSRDQAQDCARPIQDEKRTHIYGK